MPAVRSRSVRRRVMHPRLTQRCRAFRPRVGPRRQLGRVPRLRRADGWRTSSRLRGRLVRHTSRAAPSLHLRPGSNAYGYRPLRKTSAVGLCAAGQPVERVLVGADALLAQTMRRCRRLVQTTAAHTARSASFHPSSSRPCSGPSTDPNNPYRWSSQPPLNPVLTPIGWAAYVVIDGGGGECGSACRTPTLTPVSGMLAVTELADRLDVIGRLDAAIGSI